MITKIHNRFEKETEITKMIINTEMIMSLLNTVDEKIMNNCECSLNLNDASNLVWLAKQLVIEMNMTLHNCKA